ncbi:GlxA family transcriptional regulator [Pseudaminobacter salicylatoxidans]|uniref:GlxA family transcriptional regulator n=1 Tax=Pseudaminobacter salicylatoxidans TaxID=93369 RepID=UPI0003640C72|nr:helix-turn-helix domain-containing protein [Pseudaminobacter salicylatoxidans]
MKMNLDHRFPRETPPELVGIEPDIRVAFILCPMFTLLPFAAFIDSLRHAADEADFSRQIYCSWKIVADDCHTPLTASCGAEIMPQETFGAFGTLNYVVVVGGLLPHCLGLSKRARQYIRAAHDKGISIVGLCTGSFILADIGLLDNRRCAIHTEHISEFRTLYPSAVPVSGEMYVNDREVLTSPGGTSALDLAFHLIDTHCGKARAVKGLSSLLIDNHRSARRFHYRPHGHLAACGNRKVETAVEMMERHITTPYPVSELARKVGCSERELCRLFKKHGNTNPSETWRKIRMAHGHWLLLNSDRSITQISHECGFADSAHFNRWFKVIYKESPHAYRRRRRVRDQ